MVTAQTFDAPGQAFSVAVSPYDDSDLNLKLKADFEAALAERWQARMIEEAAAAFLLLFESEVVPADMAPPPPSLGSARLDGGGAEVNRPEERRVGTECVRTCRSRWGPGN